MIYSDVRQIPLYSLLAHNSADLGELPAAALAFSYICFENFGEHFAPRVVSNGFLLALGPKAILPAIEAWVAAFKDSYSLNISSTIGFVTISPSIFR